MGSKTLASKRNNETFVIHEYDLHLENTYNLIKKDLSKENAALLRQYDQHMARQSLAKATRLGQLKIALNLSRMLQKNWTDVTKNDIDELVYKIVSTYGDNKGKETNTSYDHKKILKIFFRWVKFGSREQKEVGDPPETKSVHTRPVKNNLIREELITSQDYRQLLVAAESNPRVRALIATHFEAGTRPGEILSLRIKHVKFDKFGAIIAVDGKTGPRKIRLLKSIPYLREWIESHPFKNNPDAPLWIQVEGNHYGEPVNYAATKQILQRLCRKAGIQKRITLNLFRHSRATILANQLPESLLRKRQGWTPSSTMPERYVHLIDEDLDEAYLRIHGVIKENKETDILEDMPVKCELCGYLNDPNSNICSECNRPLDLKTAIELEEKEKEKKTNLEKKLGEIDELKERLARKEQEDRERHESLLKLLKNEYQKGT